jgi:15-cis-phytoene desaturase
MIHGSVLVIGGGVGGLSAAHELAERGFAVEVYEARPRLGGKAQSQSVAGTGTGGRADLPGEHGFRFFPAFYRHVIDTMARIPDGPGGDVAVADHLRPAAEAAMCRAGHPLARFLRRRPRGPSELAGTFAVGFKQLGVTTADLVRFTERIVRYYTSCAERRLAQYEGISWWDYLGGDRYSPAFQRYLAAVPRTMVAMDARRGSARTIGDVSMQLLADQVAGGAQSDRLLCGPTTETWIDPWRRYLGALGVRFHRGTARAIRVAGGVVAGVELDGGRVVRADHYVLAVPIEALRALVGAELAALDPALARLRALPPARFARMTSWMNGLQLYLRRDVPVIRGHLCFPDSPWALTAISQPQFWRERGALEDRYGDGTVRGLISVDISDFDTIGTYVTKRGRDCTPDEIVAEVWQQLRAAIRSAHGELLVDDDLVGWHLDDELAPHAGGVVNRAPLLVHPPGSWADRPDAATLLPNLVLAGDFVRTATDIASMEAANEAARLAVNAILDRVDSPHARCRLWPMQDREPAIYAPARALDAKLFASRWTRGRHAFDFLGMDRRASAGTGIGLGAAAALGRFPELLPPQRAPSRDRAA